MEAVALLAAISALSSQRSRSKLDPKDVKEQVTKQYGTLSACLKDLIAAEGGKYWCNFVNFYAYQLNKGNVNHCISSIRALGQYFETFSSFAQQESFDADTCQKVVDMHTPELMMHLAVLLNDAHSLKSLHVKRLPFKVLHGFVSFVIMSKDFKDTVLDF